jgi:hypothetical protein
LIFPAELLSDLHFHLFLFFFFFSVCLSVAQVYRDRDQFASLVREVAAPDVGRMGIEILSFTIKGKTTTTYLRIMPLCLFVCLFALRSDGN